MTIDIATFAAYWAAKIKKRKGELIHHSSNSMFMCGKVGALPPIHRNLGPTYLL